MNTVSGFRFRALYRDLSVPVLEVTFGAFSDLGFPGFEKLSTTELFSENSTSSYDQLGIWSRCEQFSSYPHMAIQDLLHVIGARDAGYTGGRPAITQDIRLDAHRLAGLCKGENPMLMERGDWANISSRAYIVFCGRHLDQTKRQIGGMNIFYAQATSARAATAFVTQRFGYIDGVAIECRKLYDGMSEVRHLYRWRNGRSKPIEIPTEELEAPVLLGTCP